jgi:predicted dehydrogenase
MPNIAFAGVTHIHTPGFINKTLKDSRSKTIGVFDKDNERAQQAADKLNCPVIDLEKIITDDNIDGIVICSETINHYDLISQLVKTGKALFIEKPVGFSSQDSKNISSNIKENNNIFQTGYFMRAMPIHLYLKKAIENNAFGKITSINMSNCHAGAINGIFDKDYRWMADTKQCGYGGFGDLGFHSLDIMQWMIGKPKRVIASIDTILKKYPDIDEYGQGLLEFENGIFGHLRAGWVSDKNPISFELSGTEGHAYISQGKLFVFSEKLNGGDGTEAITDLPDAHPHPFQVFIDHLSADTSSPLIPLNEAVAVDITMDAFYESAKKGSWVEPDF